MKTEVPSTISLSPIFHEHSEELRELFCSIGMASPDSHYSQESFIRHINPEKCRGLGLYLNNRLISGGQLTLQRYEHVYELGFWTHKEFQRISFAYVVAQKLLDIGFSTLGAHRIFGRTTVNNTPSIAVLMKCGMVKEGELRDAVGSKEIYFNEVYYSILAHEFRSKNA